jgi:hypothetical protein
VCSGFEYVRQPTPDGVGRRPRGVDPPHAEPREAPGQGLQEFIGPVGVLRQRRRELRERHDHDECDHGQQPDDQAVIGTIAATEA